MRINAVLVGFLAVARVVLAQDATPNPETKIITVRGDPEELWKLGCVAQVACTPSRELRAIVLNGMADKIARAERNIKELDALASSVGSRSGKSVELSVYVIAGSTVPVEGVPDITGDPLSPVTRQLKGIFPYQHYQLLSAMLLRSAGGSSAFSSGVMKGLAGSTDGSHPIQYSIVYERALLNMDTIQIKNFKFKGAVPVFYGPKDKNLPYTTNQFSNADVTVNADLDIKEGQKVVVGKANVSDSDTCFFIVVSARLVP